MSKIISFLIIAAVVILVIAFIVMRYWNIARIADLFELNNVIVYGKKGKGKDVLFAAVIHKREKPHFSNIKYEESTDVKSINYLSVAPNIYENFINGNVVVIPKNIEEKKDYYLSDGGIYLPSQYDSLLSRNYPSLPIFYALSRHLGNMNVHVNVQNLNRLWIKLREQADTYIRLSGAIKLPGYILLKTTTYENYDDAVKNLKPVKKLLKGEVVRTEESSRGEIKNRLLLVPKRWLKYDSRYFHRVVYGVQSPSVNLRRKKSKKGD